MKTKPRVSSTRNGLHKVDQDQTKSSSTRNGLHKVDEDQTKSIKHEKWSS
ncbi:hypothetical protein [Metabacillus endolithicus]